MSYDDGDLDAMMEYDADYDPCERIYCGFCGCDYPCGDPVHDRMAWQVGESEIRRASAAARVARGGSR